MGQYKISDRQIKKKKRAILFNGLWGMALGVLMYFKVSTPIIVPIGLGCAFSAFMIFVGWFHHREFFYWAPRHSLQIDNGKMILNSPGSTTETELSTIEKIYVNIRRKKPQSILIVRNGNLKEHLPDYSDLPGLIKELEGYLGPERVVYKKWIHV